MVFKCRNIPIWSTEFFAFFKPSQVRFTKKQNRNMFFLVTPTMFNPSYLCLPLWCFGNNIKTIDDTTVFVFAKAKAEPVWPVQDSVSVSAVATCKREADDVRDDIGPSDQPAVAEVSLHTRESLSTSETVSDETIREIRGPKYARAKPSEEPALFTALKLRTPTAVLEVDQTLDQMELAEFGPAENPLRELATIGVLTRHGITAEQVIMNYPNLTPPWLPS